MCLHFTHSNSIITIEKVKSVIDFNLNGKIKFSTGWVNKIVAPLSDRGDDSSMAHPINWSKKLFHIF